LRRIFVACGAGVVEKGRLLVLELHCGDRDDGVGLCRGASVDNGKE
jgi:hypothetical protein